MNTAQKLRMTDGRIKAVLDAHLHFYLNAFNGNLPEEEKIPFPKIFVNVDMISLENLNGVDEYPVLSIYPSTVTASLDMIENQTIRTIWNVEAALFSYSGSVDFTARKSSYLSNLAAQCLETHLPSVGNPCIYDVQLRQTLGTKRMQMSGTTMRGWSSISTIEVYQRVSYGFSPSRVFSSPYEKPYLDNIPYFRAQIFQEDIKWLDTTLVPFASTVTPYVCAVAENSEGEYPTSVSGVLIKPDNTLLTLTFTQDPGGFWFSIFNIPAPSIGDTLYLTLVANNIPKITTIKIIN